MSFDVEGHLGALERSVSSLEREGQPARAVTLSRSFETTVDDLWDAITNAGRISRWFTPVTGELRLGGRFRLQDNAEGSITECHPPSRFALTWEFAGDVSWVEVWVADEGEGWVRATLTHTAILSEHWAAFGPGAVGVGWELALMGVALHIAHPDEPLPDAEAFATWPDGRAIIIGSSQAWSGAAIAAGEEPSTAEESARNTAIFYTGDSTATP